MRRAAIYLFAALCALYFLFYSGFEISGDERILWDGVHSLATQGNLWLNYTNPLRSPRTLPDNRPVPILDSEPGQALAALPLYWVASAIPIFGLVQTPWLLNIIVTALTAVVLLYYARLLGYSGRVALAAALLFGGATIALPYTRTFFREPLFTLLGFSSAYALERWRQRGNLGWAGAGLLCLLACFVTKDATVFFIPILLTIIAPPAMGRLDRRAILILLGAGLVSLGAILVLPRFVANGRFDVTGRLIRALNEADQAPYALAGYWISPGRGIFSFSPALLLGLGGIVVSLRSRQWHAALVPAVAFLTFTVGYAVLQNRDWYGGTGWGPRYMVPVTPFLVIGALPILGRLTRARRRSRLAAGALIAASVAVQLLAVAVPVNDYFGYLAAEGTRTGKTIVGWIDGTWNLTYIPQTVLPRIIGKTPLDLAWDVNRAPLMALLCLLIFCATLALAIRATAAQAQPQRPSTRRRWAIAVAALVPVALFSLGLWTARADPRYGGSDANARAAIDAVQRKTAPHTAVLLGSYAYLYSFMNYYRAPMPIFVLPPSPGEVDIPGRPPKVVAANLDKGVAPETTMLLARLSLITSRWLYVTEFVPGDPSRTRIMEHYLVRHYFPIDEPLTTSTARVIAFSAHDAPPDFVPPWPAQQVGARFADTFRLVGFDMPTIIRRGEALPLSILWRMDGFGAGVEPFNYSINVSLIRPDGAVAAQRTGAPLGTFGTFATWQPGDYYRDNHGLLVPPDAPPGTYEVWVLLYDWRDNHRLPVTNAGPSATDHLTLGRVTVQ